MADRGGEGRTEADRGGQRRREADTGREMPDRDPAREAQRDATQ